jgi:hypothetical protein
MAILWTLLPGKALERILFLAATALGIGILVYTITPHVLVYRGLSGVDHALAGWILAAGILQERDTLGFLGLAGLVALGACAVHTTFTGEELWQSSLPEGVAPLGLAHLVGMLMGVAWCVIGKKISPWFVSGRKHGQPAIRSQAR